MESDASTNTHRFSFLDSDQILAVEISLENQGVYYSGERLKAILTLRLGRDTCEAGREGEFANANQQHDQRIRHYSRESKPETGISERIYIDPKLWRNESFVRPSREEESNSRDKNFRNAWGNFVCRPVSDTELEDILSNKTPEPAIVKESPRHKSVRLNVGYMNVIGVMKLNKACIKNERIEAMSRTKRIGGGSWFADVPVDDNTTQIPVFSMPFSVLACDLDLEENVPVQYLYQVILPRPCPSSFEGQCAKIEYKVVLGLQFQCKECQQHQKLAHAFDHAVPLRFEHGFRMFHWMARKQSPVYNIYRPIVLKRTIASVSEQMPVSRCSFKVVSKDNPLELYRYLARTDSLVPNFSGTQLNEWYQKWVSLRNIVGNVLNQEPSHREFVASYGPNKQQEIGIILENCEDCMFILGGCVRGNIKYSSPVARTVVRLVQEEKSGDGQMWFSKTVCEQIINAAYASETRFSLLVPAHHPPTFYTTLFSVEYKLEFLVSVSETQPLECSLPARLYPLNFLGDYSLGSNKQWIMNKQ